MSKQTNWPSRLIDDVRQTEDHEIQCDQAGILMARCAQALLTDEETQRQYPVLWRHFRFCADCAEEYQMVMDFAHREATTPLSTPDRIPARPGAGTTAVWTRAKDAVLAMFPGFSPAMSHGLTRDSTQTGIELAEPIEVVLGEQAELRIEFDLAIHESDAKLRDLYCIIWADAEALRNVLEAAPVWLLIDDDGPALRHDALDDLGEVAFSAIAPGRYSLRLHVGGRDYAVTGIHIP